jgi:hypothetical protein
VKDAAYWQAVARVLAAELVQCEDPMPWDLWDWPCTHKPDDAIAWARGVVDEIGGR